jgi:hypothetical protein
MAGGDAQDRTGAPAPVLIAIKFRRVSGVVIFFQEQPTEHAQMQVDQAPWGSVCPVCIMVVLGDQPDCRGPVHAFHGQGNRLGSLLVFTGH